MRQIRSLLIAALVALLATVLAACGGDEQGTDLSHGRTMHLRRDGVQY